MTKSITLYDKTNLVDLFDKVFDQLNEKFGPPKGGLAKVRKEFEAMNDYNQVYMLEANMRHLGGSRMSAFGLEQFIEACIEDPDFVSKLKEDSVILQTLSFYTGEHMLIEIDVKAMKLNPDSGIGAHRIGDLFAASQCLLKGEIELFKTYYPEFKVHERVTDCFTPDSLEDVFTEFLESYHKDLPIALLEMVTAPSATIESTIEALYQENVIYLHQKALLKRLNAEFPNASDNKTLAEQFTFDHIRELLRNNEKNLSLVSLRKRLQKVSV